MKSIKYNFKLPFFFLFAAFFGFSCSESDNQIAEREYKEFSTWVNDQENKVESSTEEEWADIKTEYERRTTELDKKTENLTEKSYREYEETKTKFLDWNNRNEQYITIKRQQDSIATATAAAQNMNWDQELLGEYSNVSAITAENLRQAYITLLENVRAKHDNWTDADWDKADVVFDKLDKQKDQVEKNLSTKDKTKIAALQMEYRGIETGDEAESTVKSVTD